MKGHYLDPPIIYTCPSCKATATWRTQTIPRVLLCTCYAPMICTDQQNPPMDELTVLTTGPDKAIVGIASQSEGTYTIACPYCGNEQTAFAPETTLDQIRTSAAGLAAMAHNPGCPLYHNGKANANDLQAPLF